MPAYSRFPVAVDHGKGATVWDVAGKEYIDFTAGIGVCSLGYDYQPWVDAVSAQAAKLAHISNLYYAEPYAKLAQKLCTRAGMSNVMFANSGAEGNEAMIKLARKYSFDKYGKGRGTIITLHNSFHGRTLATLTATGQDKFHNYFFPFPEASAMPTPTTWTAWRRWPGHDVCAVMFELIQGEGGVLPLTGPLSPPWPTCAKSGTGCCSLTRCRPRGPHRLSVRLPAVRHLPRRGVLRQGHRRRPTLRRRDGQREVPQCVHRRDPRHHLRGQPRGAAAACCVLDTIDQSFLDKVKEKGDYLRAQIEAMDLPCLGKTRGMGLMIGIEVKATRPTGSWPPSWPSTACCVSPPGRACVCCPPWSSLRRRWTRGWPSSRTPCPKLKKITGRRLQCRKTC